MLHKRHVVLLSLRPQLHFIDLDVAARRRYLWMCGPVAHPTFVECGSRCEGQELQSCTSPLRNLPCCKLLRTKSTLRSMISSTWSLAPGTFVNGAVGTFLVSDNTPAPHNFESGTGENPLIPKIRLVSFVCDISRQVRPADAVCSLHQVWMCYWSERLSDVRRIRNVAMCGEEDRSNAGSVGGIADTRLRGFAGTGEEGLDTRF